ncbi:putative lipopolysaccharide biosynthesis protein [Vibrio orientalis CIP 102891 = ATCC 33934]|uniref:Lipopolysaccharide biosynthesis protein n=1 Tax=Vibrio orientalis CIP 102891 = ATCC 33934 TaxID=675816 RepID=C9QKS8_VIBOR|nr:lipopolysaccharide biosynthesis protein [Vibrio orientalis]EEX92413.1 putative lipopolysaccharide biosynthesis protein [Vibrio orientalis CIP 102891 = ATCC 33934]EGU48950.1 putative lipopolysaccharide biosynthesis protein [Vibrio orientalis CIP 102891 = ATCC 33934]
MSHSQIKSISLYASSVVLMKGISLITLPLMAYYLSPSQIGQLELMGVTTMFFSLVIGIAMHENLYRFIGVVKDSDEQKQKAAQLYSATLCLSIFLTALLTAAYWLLPINVAAIPDKAVGLIALVLCYEAPLAICLAWLRLKNEATLFFKVCVTTVALQVGLLIVVLNLAPSVIVIFALNVLCTFGQFLFLHYKLGFKLSLPDYSIFKGYIRYSIPLMLSGVVAFGLSGAERWVIAGTTDLQTLGMYAIAAKFALGVGILVQPFHMWWMPKRFAALEQHGTQYTAKVTQQGIMLLCMVAVIVSWSSQVFIWVALPDAYHLAASYVSLTICMMLFKELVEFTNLGILYKKQTTQLLIINIASTLSAFFICYLTIGLGIDAILLALIFGQLSRFVATYWRSQKLAPIHYQASAIFGLVVLTTLFLVTSRYQQHVELSLLMLCLQPLALVAYALRTKLLDLSTFRTAYSAFQTYIGKAQ